MRNFTATVKERQPGQPQGVVIETRFDHITLEVDDFEIARNVAAMLNGSVSTGHRRLLSVRERDPSLTGGE